MMISFNIGDGYTISFRTRGLSLPEQKKLWQRIDPEDIESLLGDTGHNLIVFGDGLALEISRTRGNNISIWCGKEQTE